MIWSQSHGADGPADGGWLQVALNEAADATRGELARWDIAAGTITAVKVGIWVLRSAASASALDIAGAFEDAFMFSAALDRTFCGLVQRFGFHDAVDFGAVAAVAGRRVVSSATAGKAATTAGATPTVGELSGNVGLAVQAGTGARPVMLNIL